MAGAGSALGGCAGMRALLHRQMVAAGVALRATSARNHCLGLRLSGAGLGPSEAAKLAVPALRAGCGTGPTRELGEVIATLAQDWAGTPGELAATAMALLAPGPS